MALMFLAGLVLGALLGWRAADRRLGEALGPLEATVEAQTVAVDRLSA